MILFPPLSSGETDKIPPVGQVGGKGYGLYWLAVNGFPTPPTWALSTEVFDAAVEQAGLTEAVAQIRRTIVATKDEWIAIQRALDHLEPQIAQITQGLYQATLPDELVAALKEIETQSAEWAVRSSATVEDHPRHSFAGQFTSLLSVLPGKNLLDATRQVWASAFKREALVYCAQKKTPLPRMAVLYQPMRPITANDRSGVAFSHSPVSTMPGVLIQAAFGAGQTVVGGYGGDLYSEHEGVVKTQAVTPAQIHVSAPDGGIVAQPPPEGSLPLTEDQARELAVIIRDITVRWGSPVDVEFVWRAGEGSTFVQVRSAMHPLVAQLIGQARQG